MERDTAGEIGDTLMQTTPSEKDDLLKQLRQIMRGYTMEQFLADRRRDCAG